MNRRMNIALALCAVSSLALTLGLAGCTNTPKADLNVAAAEADEAFQAGVNQKPTAQTLYAMARLLAMKGKDAECEWVLRRVVTDHPSFVPAYADLAELQMRQQRPDDAMKTLTMGMQVAPEDATLINNMGMCWLVKGDYPRALGLFSKAAGMMPENARYRSNMAVALGLMGHEEEARRLFQQTVTAQEADRNVDVLRQARTVSLSQVAK